jgi:hypothetical protein
LVRCKKLLIYGLFNDAISYWGYVALNDTQYWLQNWERYDVILATTPAFTWKDWGQLWRNSVRVAGLQNGIWAGELQSTKQKCYTTGHNFQSYAKLKQLVK